jgi:hypothetical protein
MSCTCGRITIGSEVTDLKNLDLDCPEHGVTSPWYNSPEQAEKRAAQDARLRDLQTQAREARMRVAIERAEQSEAEEEERPYVRPPPPNAG